MEELSGYNITKKEYNKLRQLAENVYNTSVVIDYFCTNQQEIYELYNLSPVVKYLLRDADNMNAFFINKDNDNENEEG